MPNDDITHPIPDLTGCVPAAAALAHTLIIDVYHVMTACLHHQIAQLPILTMPNGDITQPNR